MLQGQQLQKDSPQHFFVAGMDKYFPTSFWWSLSALLPYWKEIYFIAQSVKDLPAVQEIQAQSLGWKDLLEKEMATHSSIPAWKIP